MGKIASILFLVLAVILVACGGETETVEETALPDTAPTMEPATDTPIPATDTPIPATDTIEPPTLNALEIILTDQALTMESTTPIPIIEPPAPCGAEESCLELTFSDDSCTYEGPHKIAPGAIRLLFHNDREDFARVHFVKLSEFRTFEDMDAWFKGQESKLDYDPPPWTQPLDNPTLLQPIYPGRTEGRSLYLQPGNYYLICGELPLPGSGYSFLWQGAGVTVEE